MPITNTRSPLAPKQDQQLMTELWDPQISLNPKAFVLFVYPWGKAGTPLERFKEPRRWQMEELEAVADHIQSNLKRMELGLDPLVYQSATVSGRGVGKSAFVGWMEHWMMTCALGSSTIITANTETQLKTKTWPEVGKWLPMSINAHWFDKTALSIKPAPWFEELLVKQLKTDTGYYFAQATTWSEENPDAFAGHHNMNGTLLVFDEASGIPAPIWNVAKGYFTEPVLHRYHFVFSNGRRNTGPFFECFNSARNFWRGRNLDSRKVEGTDKTMLNEIIVQYGEDSDVARVEVKGEFPRQGDKQFISRELVDDARIRPLVKDEYAPLIMGVDPARFGDDSFVIRFRQGRDARSIPPIIRKKIDNVQGVSLCAEWITKLNPDGVFIDGGNGSGIIDGLRALGYKVHEVSFGGSSSNPHWANKRTEMWADMREWLKIGCIDEGPQLTVDLTAPEYEFVGQSDVQILESKDKMKKRGFASPDHADALACTFAARVARRDLTAMKKAVGNTARIAKGVDDYKVFG